MELTKQQILNNLKWHNIVDELPYDGSRVEIREIIPHDTKIGEIFDINYYLCVFYNTGDNIGKFVIHGNPYIAFDIENAMKVEKFDIDGFDELGNEILLDLSKRDTIDLEYWQWRYPVEENGETTHFTMAL